MGQIMERAKRPYEGIAAYEAGKKDAIKNLYDELIEIDKCLIINKDDIMEYLKKKVYSNNAQSNVKGE